MSVVVQGDDMKTYINGVVESAPARSAGGTELPCPCAHGPDPTRPDPLPSAFRLQMA